MCIIEQAFIRAAQECFTDVTIDGCLFHFTQCVYRHIGSCGLAKKYGNDDEFCEFMKMIMALTFVPPEHVITAYEEIVASDYYEENEDILKPFREYFEVTWVGKKKRTGRTTPLFGRELWNCYTSVMNGEPRTMNAVEGCHTRFNRRILHAAPSMGEMISALQHEQSATEAVFHERAAGRDITPRKRKKYVDYNVRIIRATQNFAPDDDLIDYLRAQSSNIRVRTTKVRD